MNFDYTPLSQPISFGDLLARLRQQPKKHQVVVWVGAAVTVLLVVMLWLTLPALIAGFSNENQKISGVNFILSLCAIVVLALPLMYIYREREQIRNLRFAQRNNLTYYTGAYQEDKSGMIFHFGHTKTFANLFGVTGSRLQEFGTYSCQTGSGRDRAVYNYGFVRLKLPRKLPHMVLDSRKENSFMMGDIARGLDKDQVLELEGDFGNYFTLYVPKSYEQDALYIFTPDVMQALVDAPHWHDSEIVDDDFYLYTMKKLNLRDPAGIEELLSLAERVTAEIDKQAATYKDERVSSGLASTAIETSGARLKTSRASQAVIIIMTVLIVCWMIFVLYY